MEALEDKESPDNKAIEGIAEYVAIPIEMCQPATFSLH